MIRFQCPTCNKVLKAPDDGGGRKTTCPKCGQRLIVPPPAQPLNQTMLGRSLPVPDAPPPPEPSCAPTQLPSNPFDFDAEPHQQEGYFAQPPARTGAGLFEGLGKVLHYDAGRKHSGLGIASFLIALLVGGMDVILALVIAVNAAKSPDSDPELRELPVRLVAGGLAMYGMNCMSLPLCIVGAGMGVVGLVAHRQHNHLFTWLGLLGNGVVILAVVGLYVFVSI